ncbi:MAG: NADH-quinone oxidoreductase subunit I, partial [Phycisphaerales bacterium]|nr:NADH-quinone oxidoreductase subunit I [Phycisphaerales bacterium]
MAIRDDDVIQLTVPPMNSEERVYLPAIFKGFGTTLRHFFTSFGQGRTSRSMQYPEERREQFSPVDGGQEPSNFRGVHRLNRDEKGRVKCVA